MASAEGKDVNNNSLNMTKWRLYLAYWLNYFKVLMNERTNERMNE